jgi:hypothetical protein
MLLSVYLKHCKAVDGLKMLSVRFLSTPDLGYVAFDCQVSSHSGQGFSSLSSVNSGYNSISKDLVTTEQIFNRIFIHVLV